DWTKTRTGNALLKKHVLRDTEHPFRTEFRAGEDTDFFRRMIEKGHVFAWCNEAVVSEIIPPKRCKHTFMLRKALLRGAAARLQPSCGVLDIGKSIIALPIYAVALPFALMLGHHRFMILLVKLSDHLGKLLAVIGVDPIKEPYVTE